MLLYVLDLGVKHRGPKEDTFRDMLSVYVSKTWAITNKRKRKSLQH